MVKVNQYSVKGVKMEEFTLPERFAQKENQSLLSQAIHVYRDRLHLGLAKVKSRGEVDRTTKKVYRQKGTGGARHGAKSAPIFVGGGVAHGPKGVKRTLTLAKGMRAKALDLALSLAAKEEKVFVVSGLAKVTKTGEVARVLAKIGSERFLVALAKKNNSVARFTKNITGVKTMAFASLNAYDVFVGGKLILDSDIFEKAVKEEKAKVVKKTEKVSKTTKVAKTVKKEKK